MTKNILWAPGTLAEWFSSRRPDQHVGNAKLRLPQSPEVGNKAVLLMELGKHVGSFTIWGSGTVEWLVLNAESREIVISSDQEFCNAEQLLGLLDAALTQMSRL